MMLVLRRVASKLLALALLGAAGMLAYLLAAAPLAGRYRDARERIGAERVLLGRLEAQSAAPESADAAVRKARIDAGRALMLPGGSDAVRIAGLQALAGRIAEEEGISIRSTRVLPAREQDGVRMLGVEAQLSAGLPALQRLLHKLESGTPLLLVEQLHVLPPALLGADNPEAGAMLDVRIGLMGVAPARKE